MEKLALYWAYPFVRYALVVGVLIALCSSLLGVTLVLRRFSFIGDGLSHVAFGAMAVSAVLGLTDHMPLTLGVTVACAILLLRTGRDTKIQGDAAIAMLSVGALAMGYLLMNLFFHLLQPVRGCVQHPVRVHIHPDPDEGGGVPVCWTVRCGGGGVPAVLQQNFCRHL